MKTAVVTGTSTGIGLATAVTLARVLLQQAERAAESGQLRL